MLQDVTRVLRLTALMARQEIISPEGLRQDGRRATELRSFSSDMGILPFGEIDGSAIFEIGNTKVLATVVGPREALEKTSIASETDSGYLSVKIHAAAFSSTSGERRARNDRRLSEWSRIVEQAFTSSVMSESFPRSQVDVFVEVLNADGGVLAAIVNAINLALIDAGVPMRDYVVAVCVAYVQNTAVLDPNRQEESGNSPTITFAFLPRTGQVVLVNAEPRMASEKLGSLFSIASGGANKIFEKMDSDTVRPRLACLFGQRQALLIK